MHEHKGAYALLLGSGVSRGAGIPTGWEVVIDLIRKVAALENENCDPEDGQFARVTGSDDEIDKAPKTDNAFWIYTKDPNAQAFMDLMNRAIDKPAEHVQVAGAGGGPIVIQWMRPDEETKKLWRPPVLSRSKRVRSTMKPSEQSINPAPSLKTQRA